jgi:hypothetical protein
MSHTLAEEAEGGKQLRLEPADVGKVALAGRDAGDHTVSFVW